MALQNHVPEPLLRALVILVLIPQIVTVAFAQSNLTKEYDTARLQEENLRLAQLNVIIGALAAIGGAIGGGYFGAHFAAKHGERLEKVKVETLKQNVRILVKPELEIYLNLMRRILQEGVKIRSGSQRCVTNGELKEHIDMIREYGPKYYRAMSVETKAQSFEPDLLKELEKLYRELDVFLKEGIFSGGELEGYKCEEIYITEELERYKKRLELAIQKLLK